MMLLGDMNCYPFLNETELYEVLSFEEYKKTYIDSNPTSSNNRLDSDLKSLVFLVNEPLKRPIFRIHVTVPVTYIDIVFYEYPSGKVMGRLNELSEPVSQGTEFIAPFINKQFGWDGCAGLQLPCPIKNKYRVCVEAKLQGTEKWNIVHRNPAYCTQAFSIDRTTLET
ncbi:hypothetical protein HMI54_013314 [Coelomomyces lativittatus]|nr:hypothetical protein HMI56_005616 [Coelomomyces lativittatus]KAJ1497793.1 hypothetical protein HMI54_013314 [Coelomomyces lativittatus]